MRAKVATPGSCIVSRPCSCFLQGIYHSFDPESQMVEQPFEAPARSPPAFRSSWGGCSCRCTADLSAAPLRLGLLPDRASALLSTHVTWDPPHRCGGAAQPRRHLPLPVRRQKQANIRSSRSFVQARNNQNEKGKRASDRRFRLPPCPLALSVVDSMGSD